MTLKLSVSGVRGIVAKSLTPEICSSFAEAFATFTGEGNIVVGCDTRPSRGELREAVFEGLQRAGCTVIDAGIIPTPSVSILVKELKAVGGIVITASHNPAEWNGLKFINDRGLFLNQTEAKNFFDLWRSGKFAKGSRRSVPKKLEGPFGPHLSRIFGKINTRIIGSKKFKVALDCVNGAGSKITQKLLRDLGCKVYAINTNVDLEFPHSPEPTPENIRDLCALVKKHKADVGFAQDPDGDRLAIVSEKGEPIGEEYTLAMAVDHILKSRIKNPKSKIVVTNLSTTMAIDEIAGKHGAKVMRTKIGEINVAEEMIKQNAIIGGEGNGGVIYPEVSYNRDSLIGIALILEYMAETGKTISELVAGLPNYYMVKSKINCPSAEEAQKLMKKAEEKFKGEKLDRTDGIKIIFEDSWVHVRPSNTEPITRIIAEARSRDQAEKLIKEIPGA
jgi:phosphomannomutase